MIELTLYKPNDWIYQTIGQIAYSNDRINPATTPYELTNSI